MKTAPTFELAEELVARTAEALPVAPPALLCEQARALVAALGRLQLDQQTLQAAAAYMLFGTDRQLIEALPAELRALVSQARRARESVERVPPEDWATERDKLILMFLSIARDVRSVLICLTERQCELEQASELPVEQQRTLAHETMEIYAPIASRLGIWSIKSGLEDRAFALSEPEISSTLAEQLDQLTRDRKEYIERVAEQLREVLKNHGVEATITGRAKHLNSIWQKMQSQHRRFDQIYDIIAVRVLVESVKDCYSVMGLVHSLWRPVPGRIKDYIAVPRNMYQSLHTTVICEDEIPIEIQIRTYAMHEVAEYGVAAHWRYKEERYNRRQIGRDALEHGIQRTLNDARRALSGGRPLDLAKVDLGQDQVFVFTPKGKIIELPVGSTPVDFAYHIHSDVGHSCVGARINERMVPLDYQLRSGDRVQILTSKAGRGPSRDWLTFVRTASARNHIKRYFKKLEYAENVAAGRELLEKELRRLGLSSAFEEIAEQVGEKSAESLFAKIGAGDLTARQVAQKVLARQLASQEATQLEQIGPPSGQPSNPPRSSSGAIVINGVDGLLTRFARCCNPVQGEPIVGYVTRGRGVTIHRADCRTIRNEPDRGRLLEAVWGNAQGSYVVPLRIEAWDRIGLWRDVSSTIADNGINIREAQQQPSRRQGRVVLMILIEIAHLAQLTTLIDKLNRIPSVIDARRESNVSHA